MAQVIEITAGRKRQQRTRTAARPVAGSEAPDAPTGSEGLLVAWVEGMQELDRLRALLGQIAAASEAIGDGTRLRAFVRQKCSEAWPIESAAAL